MENYPYQVITFSFKHAVAARKSPTSHHCITKYSANVTACVFPYDISFESFFHKSGKHKALLLYVLGCVVLYPQVGGNFGDKPCIRISLLQIPSMIHSTDHHLKIDIRKITVNVNKLTLKAPIMTAADDKFWDIFPNFQQK